MSRYSSDEVYNGVIPKIFAFPNARLSKCAHSLFKPFQTLVCQDLVIPYRILVRSGVLYNSIDMYCLLVKPSLGLSVGSSFSIETGTN